MAFLGLENQSALQLYTGGPCDTGKPPARGTTTWRTQYGATCEQDPLLQWRSSTRGLPGGERVRRATPLSLLRAGPWMTMNVPCVLISGLQTGFSEKNVGIFTNLDPSTMRISHSLWRFMAPILESTKWRESWPHHIRDKKGGKLFQLPFAHFQTRITASTASCQGDTCRVITKEVITKTPSVGSGTLLSPETKNKHCFPGTHTADVCPPLAWAEQRTESPTPPTSPRPNSQPT